MHDDHGEKNTNARRDNRYGQSHVQHCEIIAWTRTIDVGVGHHHRETKNDDHPGAVNEGVHGPAKKELFQMGRHGVAELQVIGEIEV